MQTKNAIGNLVNRYRAVLKKCNLLNTFGSLAIASAIALSGAGAAAAAVTFTGDVSLSGENGTSDPSKAAGAYRIGADGSWVSNEAGVTVSQQDKDGKPDFAEGDGNYGIYLNGGAPDAAITLGGANFVVKTDDHAGYGARVGFQGGTINIAKDSENTVGQMLTIDTRGNSELKLIASGDGTKNGKLIVTGYLTTTEGSEADLSGADIYVKSGKLGTSEDVVAGGMMHGDASGITVGNLWFDDSVLAHFANDNTGAETNELAIKDGSVNFLGESRITSVKNGNEDAGDILKFTKDGSSTNSGVLVGEGASLAIQTNTAIGAGVTFMNHGTVDLQQDFILEGADAELEITTSGIFGKGTGVVRVGSPDEETTASINIMPNGVFNVSGLNVAGDSDTAAVLTFKNDHNSHLDEGKGGNIADKGTNAYAETLTVGENGTVNIEGVSKNGLNVALAVGDLKLENGGKVVIKQNGTLEIARENYDLADGFIAADKVNIATGGRFKAVNVDYRGIAFNTAGMLDFETLTVANEAQTLALSGGGSLRVESGLTAEKGITINDFALNLKGENDGAVTGAVVLKDTSAALNVEEGAWTVSDLTVTNGNVIIGKAGSDIDGVLTVDGTLKAGSTAGAVTVKADGKLVANGAVNASNGAIKVESVGVAAIDYDNIGVGTTYTAGGIELEQGAILEVAYSGETWGSEEKEKLFSGGTTDGQIKFAAGSPVRVEGNTVEDLNGYHVADTTLRYDAAATGGDTNIALNTTVKDITVENASADVTVKAKNLGLVGSADGGDLIAGAGKNAVSVQVQDNGLFRLGDTTSTAYNKGTLNAAITQASATGGEIQSVNGAYTVTGGINAANSTFVAYNSEFVSLGNVKVKGLSLNSASFVADCKTEVGDKGIKFDGEKSSVSAIWDEAKVSTNSAAEGSITNAGAVRGSGTIYADNYYRQTLASAQDFTGNVLIDAGNKAVATDGTLDKDGKFLANRGAAIEFGNAVNVKSGSNVTLDAGLGDVKFGGNVTVGESGAAAESTLYISKLAEQGAAYTFKAQGNSADDISGFIQVADLGTANTARTFETADNGFISLGSMDFETMKYHIGLADEAAKLAERDSDFMYASAVAVSGKELNLANNNIHVGATANALDVAADHLLIADVAGLTGETALIKGDGTATVVKIADGAGVHLVNAKGGQEYVLVSGAHTGSSVADINVNKSTDNILVKFDSITLNSGKIIAETVVEKATNIFTGMDASLGALVDSFNTNGSNAFLAGALSTTSGMTAAQAAQTIEGAAKAPMVVGAPQTAVSVATQGADYAMARTSFAPRVAGAAAVAENGEYTNISAGDNMANGMNLWIMPMYQNNKADGYKSGAYQMAYDSDFYGVAVGGDYTWDNSFRLGATVNMGTGSAESTGTFAKTENDYDSVGVGIYAGYMLGNLGLSADVNYTNVSNDITQSNSVMALAADGDIDVWSIGARAEYKIATSAMDIIPHIGLRWSNISMDAMNFSGVLTTDADSANVWQLPIGVTFAKDFATESGWNIKPALDLAVIPAFGDTDMAQTVQFAGVNGIASMDTEIMDDVSGRAQLGVEVSKDQFYFGVDYAYQGSSNMDSHGVQANIGFKF